MHLKGFSGTIANGGRQITSLRFTDDKDIIVGSKDEKAYEPTLFNRTTV